MTPEVAQFSNRGMNQDISVSKATNEFAFENYNIRITAVNDNTLLSVTNEKLPTSISVNLKGEALIPNKLSIVKYEGSSTTYVELEYIAEENIAFKINDSSTYGINKGHRFISFDFDVTSVEILSPIDGKGSKYIYYTDSIPEDNTITYDHIPGKYLGHAILNDKLILFTKGDKDYILVFTYNESTNTLEGNIKYKGDLNFQLDKHIETLPYYESELVQKVYWVDGINQPRVINIAADNIVERLDTQFDFNPTITEFPYVTITKEYSGVGLFPAGVIQYFVSYYNKYGAETGIVWSSDLQYVTEYNRALGPDETVVCSFKIDISNIDTTYDYVRVYSMQRTSLNTTPICRIVGDININNSRTASIIDTNTNTETIDPTQLLFLGGDNFIASTLTQKDDVLFLGDLTIDNIEVPQEIKDLFAIPEGKTKLDYLKSETISTNNDTYKSFKKGEWYRVGIQFQDSTTKWTVPIFIGDIQIDVYSLAKDRVPIITFDIYHMFEYNEEAKNLLSRYSNFRLVMVETSDSTRNILAQGIVTPTVFNHAERVNKSGPHSIASWIMRPRNGNAQFEHLGGLGNIVKKDEEGKKQYLNLTTCEIQNSLEALPVTGNVSYEGSELTNNYYVDSSILNFYSPDTERVASLLGDQNIKFRIIGAAPINNSTSDIILETSTNGYLSDSGLVKNSTVIVRRGTNENTTINDSYIRRPVYKDALFIDNKINKTSSGKYFIYLWHKEDSIIGQTSDSLGTDGKPLTQSYADLFHKIIANKRTSLWPIYFDKNKVLEYNVQPTVFNSENIESKAFNLSSYKTAIYQGNYDSLVTSRSEGLTSNSEKEDFSYRVFYTREKTYTSNNNRPGMGSSSAIPHDRSAYNYSDIKQYSPVRIKYKTTPHITFALKSNESSSEYKILPYLSSNNESAWVLTDLYPPEYFNIPDTIKYPWLEDTETYSQDVIDDVEVGREPYLFIGELYRDKDIEFLYGNPTQENLERHTWIPISKALSIEAHLQNPISYGTQGDTYYQLWDCLSSYPFTEEDHNSVIDITSFYVETHINLEGRYDKHKNIENILTVRKDNFNKINPVYSQTNNYFTYNILDEKFNQNKYFNQVAFSLQKTPTSEIDTWCNISLASAFNLDGKYGKLNKLITINDAIIAFQDKALSVINFNNRTAISTENGVPIEIANSGKVNGYSVISSNVGCQNKLSICEASSGVYFIDDLNKAMYGFNKEGLSNISSKGMSMWFKKNLTGKEKCFYDKLTNDVYITNENNCLVYNEALDAFTSFMEYVKIHSLFNFEGKFILFNFDPDIVDPQLMFGGSYSNNYYIQYKINPEPLTDKTFTNIEYIADCFNEQDVIDSNNVQLDINDKPFKLLEVWNEYQKGSTDLTTYRFRYPNSEKKFRINRVDIPRADYNNRDRIRNPWIYLKLSKKGGFNNNKMAFHSFLVKYYK